MVVVKNIKSKKKKEGEVWQHNKLSLGKSDKDFPANIPLSKINNRNTRKRCEMC